MIIKTDWTQFKTAVGLNKPLVRYTDINNKYIIFFDVSNNCSLNSILSKDSSSDTVDFEDNYKSFANSTNGINVNISSVPSTNPTLYYTDMAAIARGTTITPGMSWTTVFSYSGSGSIYGWTLGLNTAQSNWYIRMIIDGHEIFSSNGILTDDISSSTLLNLATGTAPTAPGINITSGTSNIKWSGPLGLPVKYNTSIQILVKRVVTNKVFSGGLIVLTKDT